MRALIVAVAFAAVLLLVVSVMWFFSDGRAADNAHDDALAMWESTEPAAYAFDFSYCSGMCEGCPIHVTVRNGEVAEVVHLEDRCADNPLTGGPTVEDVFALEKGDRSGAYTDSFDIVYDADWGFPASVEIHCPDGWSDCGTGYSIGNFEVLEPRSSSTTPST